MQIGLLGPCEVRTDDGGFADVPGARFAWNVRNSARADIQPCARLPALRQKRTFAELAEFLLSSLKRALWPPR